MEIKVAGFVRNSFVDWPKKIAFAVFLGGCNFTCPHCHNHAIARASANRIPWGGVLDEIRQQIGFIDGVVISGGEPTAHPRLREIIGDVRALGLPVKLDTNGSDFETLRELVETGQVDFVAMDIKAPLERYAELGFLGAADAHGAVGNVRKSIAFLRANGVEFMFRTTPIPELTARDLDGVKQLAGGAKWVRNDFVPTS